VDWYAVALKVAELGGYNAVKELSEWPQVLRAWRPEASGKVAAAQLAELYKTYCLTYERALSSGEGCCCWWW
jgi:hypothetical protein